MMTYKLAFALVMLTLLLGLCGGCYAQGEVIPLTDDSDSPSQTHDTDVDSDSDSDSEPQKGKAPFVWMPRISCENNLWIFTAELREVQTDKVWIEVYKEQAARDMIAMFPLYETRNNDWYSQWSGEEYGVYCNRDYWFSFVAENRHGSDRGYQKWTASE
jgi:hypothetical protein